MDPHDQSLIPPPIQADRIAASPPPVHVVQAQIVELNFADQLVPRGRRFRRGRKKRRGRPRRTHESSQRRVPKRSTFSVVGYITSAITGTGIGFALLRWLEIL